MDFWSTLAIATIPAIIASLIAYFGNRVEILKYKQETMAERAAKSYLQHKGYTDRKFDTIKKRLGGYDSDPDELRRILVRAGAERSFRTELGEQIEYWTLISRKKEKILKLKSKKSHG